MWRLRKTLYISIVSFKCYLMVFVLIVIALMALGLISYVFLMVNEKQMKIKQDIDRTRILRYKANEGKRGMNVLPERERENLELGRTIM